MDSSNLKAPANKNAAKYLERLRVLRNRLPASDQHEPILRAIYTVAIILAELMIQQAEDK